MKKLNRKSCVRMIIAALLGILLALYCGFPVLVAYIYQHVPPKEVCCQTPADFNLAYEEVTLTTSDEVELSGWYIPSQNGAAIMAVHGSGDNRIGVLSQSAMLAEAGYGVLLFDLRGHGDSGGEAMPYGGWSSDKDITAALDFLEERDDVNPEKIGAIGFSLGGEILIRATARDKRIKALVSDGAGYDSLKGYILLPTPFKWLMVPMIGIALKSTEVFSGVEQPDTSLKDVIPDIAPRAVFLIAAGQVREEKQLNEIYYDAAGEPKTLWVIDNAGHVAGWFTERATYEKRVLAFFGEALQISLDESEN